MIKKENRKTEYNRYNAFKKYIVYAESLQEFIDVWHNPAKINDFNREADYEDHKAELLKYGFTFIPASTSINGKIVSYYGKV